MKDPKARTPDGDEWGDLWTKGERVVQVVHVRIGEAKPLQTDTRIRDSDTTTLYTRDELEAEGWTRDKSLNYMSDAYLRQALARGRHAETVLGRRHVAAAQEVEARISTGSRFLDRELVYSASALCPCGYGLAYPEGIGMHGAWYCSGVLTGRADRDSTDHAVAPFATSDIRSERSYVDPARNATTRGVFRPRSVNA